MRGRGGVPDTLHLYLLLGLVDGFQVYRVHAPDDVRLVVSFQDGTVSSLTFLPDPSTFPSEDLDLDADGLDRSITAPAPSGYRITGNLLAVSFADDKTCSNVKIFSIDKRKYVHLLRFPNRVHGLSTSASALAVALEKEIHVFNARTAEFDFIFSVRCYPNPPGGAIMALGPRWIAYASCDKPPSPALNAVAGPGAGPGGPSSSWSPSSAPSPSLSSNPLSGPPPPFSLAPAAAPASYSASIGSLLSSASSIYPGAANASYSAALANMATVGKDIATGLYTLGESGRKKISSSIAVIAGAIPTALPAALQPNSAPASPALSVGMPPVNPVAAINANTVEAPGRDREKEALEQAAGTVVVLDLKRQSVVAHFQAHTSPLVSLQFDSSGTLLATAPEPGQYIHVYQICAVYNNYLHAELAASAVTHTSPFLPLQLSNSPTSSPAPAPERGAEAKDKRSDDKSKSRTKQSHDSDGAAATTQTYYYTRHLYRLYRGITHATLRSLSFSSDSKVLLAASSRGTAHLFAINPQGGFPTPLTHGPRALLGPAPASPSRRGERGAAYALSSYVHPFEFPETLTMNSVNRLKLPSSSVAAALLSGHSPSSNQKTAGSSPPSHSSLSDSEKPLPAHLLTFADHCPVVGFFHNFVSVADDGASSMSGTVPSKSDGNNGKGPSGPALRLPGPVQRPKQSRDFDQLLMLGSSSSGAELMWLYSLYSSFEAEARTDPITTGNGSPNSSTIAELADGHQSAAPSSAAQFLPSWAWTPADTNSPNVGAHATPSLNFEASPLNVWDFSAVKAAESIDELESDSRFIPSRSNPMGFLKSKNPSATPSASAQRSRWLANAEIRTFEHTASEIPIWGRPQYSLRIYPERETLPRRGAQSELNSLFADDHDGIPLKYTKFSSFPGLSRGIGQREDARPDDDDDASSTGSLLSGTSANLMSDIEEARSQVIVSTSMEDHLEQSSISHAPRINIIQGYYGTAPSQSSTLGAASSTSSSSTAAPASVTPSTHAHRSHVHVFPEPQLSRPPAPIKAPPTTPSAPKAERKQEPVVPAREVIPMPEPPVKKPISKLIEIDESYTHFGVPSQNTSSPQNPQGNVNTKVDTRTQDPMTLSVGMGPQRLFRLDFDTLNEEPAASASIYDPASFSAAMSRMEDSFMERPAVLDSDYVVRDQPPRVDLSQKPTAETFKPQPSSVLSQSSKSLKSDSSISSVSKDEKTTAPSVPKRSPSNANIAGASAVTAAGNVSSSVVKSASSTRLKNVLSTNPVSSLPSPSASSLRALPRDSDSEDSPVVKLAERKDVKPSITVRTASENANAHESSSPNPSGVSRRHGKKKN